MTQQLTAGHDGQGAHDGQGGSDQRGPAPARRFRPEIEGLRAVAALLVAVYHVYLGRVSGGVDVFFVVAGFLITTSLLGNVARTGSLGASRYLSRLARRLLPTALVVLGAVLVATLLWMPVTRRAGTFREIIASALYVENWSLAATSVDYLSRDQAPSPLQHFWAMSIQGQFYLLWLGVFAIALAVGRAHVRRTLTGLLLTLLVTSLAFSVLLTGQNQPLAYFHTGTRVWEFAAGGLLALGLARVRLPRRVAVVAGWVGLAAIVLCGILLPVADSFPGWIALWPVTGALLVVASGDTPSRWGVARLLGSRPLTYLGSISYGLYLWHWPILVFYLMRTGRETAPLLHGLVVIGLALVLAVVTTRLVERPVRTAPEPVARRVVPVLVVLVASVVVAAAGSLTAVDRGRTPPPAADDPRYPGAVAREPGAPFVAEPDDLLADLDLVAAEQDHASVYDDGCHQKPADPEVLLCTYGDPDGDRTVLLAGGSHAAHWFPTLETIAADEGWRLISATKSACLFSAEQGDDDDESRSCEQWNRDLVTSIADLAPDLVVTTATRTGKQETLPPAYLDRWHDLDRLGVPVLALRDTPRGSFSVPDCLAGPGASMASCSFPRARSLAEVSPLDDVPDLPGNVVLGDLTDYFCDDVRCPPVIGGIVVYYDHSHMTARFARSLADPLRPLVVGALGD